MSDIKRQLASVLSGDDNLDRACKSIPAESCEETSWNFTRNVANGAASKLAEQIAGPNLILPWLFQILGTPAWMFAFLMPIKQSFSLLPQMVVAGRIRRLSVRKWVWVVAGLTQTCCLLLMIPTALWLQPQTAGFTLLLLLVLFSCASGTSSVAFQDVLGKTIDKGHRGRLLARRAFVGGILTTAAGLILNRVRESQQDLSSVLVLIFIAALLWGLAALFFAMIRERPGATQGGRNAAEETRAGFSLYKQYPGFRKFLHGRSLLLSVELATPFFVLHAGQLMDLKVQDIGILVIAVGISQIVSSPFWGKMADQTSKKVMILSALIAFIATILALLAGTVPSKSLQYGCYFVIFVLIGLAESGVRLGRKTYLVDASPKQDRTTFTAFSNSVVGVLALLSGSIGMIAHWAGATAMLATLAGLILLAFFTCRSMPEAEQMLRADPAAAGNQTDS